MQQKRTTTSKEQTGDASEAGSALPIQAEVVLRAVAVAEPVVIGRQRHHTARRRPTHEHNWSNDVGTHPR